MDIYIELQTFQQDKREGGSDYRGNVFVINSLNHSRTNNYTGNILAINAMFRIRIAAVLAGAPAGTHAAALADLAGGCGVPRNQI